MRLLVLSILLAASAHAQTATLYVATETPDALVAVSGDILGAAESGPFEIEVGEQTVALVEPSGAWDGRRAETTITATAGDTLTVELDLPVRTRIESLPLHAHIVLVRPDGDEEVLGSTPLVVDRPGGLDGTIIARLDGHTDASVRAPRDGGRVSLVLRPEDLELGETFTHSLPTRRSNPRRSLLDVGLGTLAVAAGAVAVHYKFRADAADDEYRAIESLNRGDVSFLNEARRLDSYSGLALGVSTASLGVLAIRLALR